MSIRVSSLVWEHGPEKSADMLMLLALADNANDDGEAWPSIERLARKCRVDRRTAQRTIRRLEDSGYLHTVVGGYVPGREGGIPSRYQLNLTLLREGAAPTPSPTVEGAASECRGGGVSVPEGAAPTPPEPSVEPSVEPSLTTLGDSELSPPAQLALVGAADIERTDPIEIEFNSFWKHWPARRRGSRKVALAKYRAARRRVPMEVIAAGFREHLQVFTAQVANGDEQYVPNASTWLHQERWNNPAPPMPRPRLAGDPWANLDPDADYGGGIFGATRPPESVIQPAIFGGTP